MEHRDSDSSTKKDLNGSIREIRAELSKIWRRTKRTLEKAKTAGLIGNTDRMSNDELDMFKQTLRARGHLVENDACQQKIDLNFTNFQTALNGQFDERIIKYFLESFDRSRILIIDTNVFPRIVSQFMDEISSNENSEARYAKIPDLIFMRGDLLNEDAYFHLFLAEELAHRLLDIVNAKQGFSMIASRLLRTRSLPPGSSIYYSDPCEQIAKAIALRTVAHLGIGDENMQDSQYRLSATFGENRIAELGWPKILTGHYQCSDERSLVVSENYSEARQKLKELGQ